MEASLCNLKTEYTCSIQLEEPCFENPHHKVSFLEPSVPKEAFAPASTENCQPKYPSLISPNLPLEKVASSPCMNKLRLRSPLSLTCGCERT